MGKPRIKKRLWKLALPGLLSPGIAPAGQVVVDNSFGHPGALTGPNFTVGPGVGRQVGPNLFHSFSTLNLDKGETATFTASAATHNILARVTGGSASHIDGTIATRLETSPTTPHPANFYLINPAGVIFGPDAQLDVGGSFAVTTADYVKLADGVRFTSVPSASDATLSIAPPAAFGFLSASPAPVSVQGRATQDSSGTVVHQPTLSPGGGGSITIVAGSVTITGGSIEGAGGAVTVAAVGSPGEANLTPTGVDLSALSALGPVTLVGDGEIASTGSGIGGPVSVTAGSLSLDGGQFTTGSISSSGSSADAVTVSISGNLSVINGGAISSSGYSGTNGPVTVTASSLSVDGGANGIGGIFSRGSTGGSVSVSASNEMSLTNGGEIYSSGSSGVGGAVIVKAGALGADGGQFFSSGIFSSGRDFNSVVGGAVSVSASGVISLTNGASISSSNSYYFPGALTVTAGTLSLDGIGSSIVSGTIDGAVGGSVNISATGNISVSGGATVRSIGPSGGGEVRIGANQLLVTGEGSNIAVAGVGDIHLSVDTLTVANGATIYTTAVTDGSPISSPSPVGVVAGAVIVSARDVTLDGGPSTDPTGIIASGNIPAPGATSVSITSGALTLRNNASVSADSFDTVAAGTVHVAIAGPATLESRGSVTARSYNGADGGGVTFSAESLLLTGGALISASNFRGGAAGTVNVRADAITLDQSSTISATGGGGISQPLTVEVDLTNPLEASGNLVLISQGGTHVALIQAGTLNPGDFGDDKSSPVLIQPATPLSKFVAGDLNGVWQLQVQNAQVAGSTSPSPVTITDWSLSLGNQVIGGSSIPVSGSNFISPLSVVGAVAGFTGGHGGDVNVTTSGHLNVFGGSSISAGTVGTDSAGSVIVNAGSVRVGGAGSVIESTSPTSGGAGSVTVKARSKFIATDGGAVSVSAGTAIGGSVDISARDSVKLRRGLISATVDPNSTGAGGNIVIKSGMVYILDSRITASAGALGGHITIDPNVVTLNNSTIDGRSKGTPVAVSFPGALLLRSNSQILTKSLALPPEVDIAGSLVLLPAPLLGNAAGLLPQCGVQFGDNQSSFVITGRGGAPAEPGGWLPEMELDLRPNSERDSGGH